MKTMIHVVESRIMCMQHGQSHVRALYPQGDLPDVALELMIDVCMTVSVVTSSIQC